MSGSALRPGGGTREWRRICAAVLAENPLCHWCGAVATDVDHVIPRARGGNDDPANLVPSCHGCNLARGGSMPDAPPSRSW